MKASKQMVWHKSPLGQKTASHEGLSGRQSAQSPVDSANTVSPSYYIACSALGLVLVGIFSFFQFGQQKSGLQVQLSDECQYLSHLNLAGQYQGQDRNAIRCLSQVRYLGGRHQHTLRYSASGTEGVIAEMRISLRLGEKERLEALDELIRFGQSLSLPVLGHTMPPEVGQYLRQGEVGQWDFSRASIYIERHRYPASPIVAKGKEGIAFEDVELVFRKNSVH